MDLKKKININFKLLIVFKYIIFSKLSDYKKFIKNINN